MEGSLQSTSLSLDGKRRPTMKEAAIELACKSCDEETEPAMSIAVYDSSSISDTTHFSTTAEPTEFSFSELNYFYFCG